MNDGLQPGNIPVRDAKGHFIKGNPLAAEAGKLGGRPKDSNKKEYLAIMRDFLTPEKWTQLIGSAYRDATEGETAHDRNLGREFFAKRLLPAKVELEFTGEIPVKVVAVEGFEGWQNEETKQ